MLQVCCQQHDMTCWQEEWSFINPTIIHICHSMDNSFNSRCMAVVYMKLEYGMVVVGGGGDIYHDHDS